MAKIKGFPVGVKFSDLEQGELFVANRAEGAFYGLKGDDNGQMVAVVLAVPGGFDGLAPHFYDPAIFDGFFRLPYDPQIEPIEDGLPKRDLDAYRGSLMFDDAGKVWLRLAKLQWRWDVEIETGTFGVAGKVLLETRAWRLVGHDGDREIELMRHPEPKLAAALAL